MKKQLFLLLSAIFWCCPGFILYAQFPDCEYTTGVITDLDPLPEARYSGLTCVINGKIYLTGGISESNNSVYYSDSLVVFDPATGLWDRSKTPIPFSRSNIYGSCVVDGKWYLPGGAKWINEGGNAIAVAYARFDVYDPGTDSWELKENMPEAIGEAGVASLNGKIYVSGGYNNSGQVLKSLFMYDPLTDKWTQKAEMSTARRSHFMVALKGMLYCINGTDGIDVLRNAEVYDPEKDEWKPIPLPRRSLRNHGGCIIEDDIYIFGGTIVNQSGYLTNIISRYSPATEQWTDVGKLKRAVVGPCGHAIGKTLYIIGGADSYVSYDDFYTWEMSDIHLKKSLPDTIIEGDTLVIDLSEYFTNIKGNPVTYKVCNQSGIIPSVEGSILTIIGTKIKNVLVNILAESGEHQMGDDFSVNVLNTSIYKRDALEPSLEVYPNPSSGITSLKYDIKKHGEVKLTIYDMLGRKITTLVTETQYPGSYEYSLNAEGFIPGIYLCELRTLTTKETVRLIVE